MGEIAIFNRGTAITADQTSSGSVPVVANGPRPVYYHADFNREGETVVVARSGANAGNVSFWNEPIFLTDAFSVHPDPEVMTPKFTYYLLRSLQGKIRGLKKGSGVPHIQVKAMDAIEVCVPSFDEQHRIVDILDRLDTAVEDLSNALPAEITARRRQYEHYRDRLLTFKQAA